MSSLPARGFLAAPGPCLQEPPPRAGGLEGAKVTAGRGPSLWELCEPFRALKLLLDKWKNFLCGSSWCWDKWGLQGFVLWWGKGRKAERRRSAAGLQAGGAEAGEQMLPFSRSKVETCWSCTARSASAPLGSAEASALSSRSAEAVQPLYGFLEHSPSRLGETMAPAAATWRVAQPGQAAFHGNLALGSVWCQ